MRWIFIPVCVLLVACQPQASAPAASHPRCVIIGCDGEVCADARHSTESSQCSWPPKSSCYRTHGVCAVLKSGECGWRPTPELNDCLDRPDSTMLYRERRKEREEMLEREQEQQKGVNRILPIKPIDGL